MKVAATIIERITASAVTEDGRHMVLTLRDAELNEITLGIPSEVIPSLIESGARALSDSEQVLRPSAERRTRAMVTWWNLMRDETGDGYALVLTFGAGASMAFALSPPMAHAMLTTLHAYLNDPESECRGFGA